jgi:hypothetical protein
MLTSSDIADLLGVASSAPTVSLVLYRRNANSGQPDPLPAQTVTVVYAQRQPEMAGMAGVDATKTPLSLYKAPPFNVQAGDWFELHGHKGGVIQRVLTDPVLGLIQAEAVIDTGAP